MFDQFNQQRKLKNWKILNNSNQIQQQNQNNKSLFAEQPKRYCPRKNTSKQKIFSKSKQRLNSFAAENVSQSSNSHKINELKIKMLKNIPFSGNRNVVDQGVQTNKNLFLQELALQNYLTNFNDSRIKNRNFPQKQEKNQIIFEKQNIFSKKQNPQVINTIQKTNLKIQNEGDQIHNDRQIYGDFVGIKQIKQEFENFKILILSELNKQKQFMIDLIRNFIEKSQQLRNQDVFSDVSHKYFQQRILEQKNKKISDYDKVKPERRNFQQMKPVKAQNRSNFLFLQKSSQLKTPRSFQSHQYSEVQKWNKGQDEAYELIVKTSLSGSEQLKSKNQKQTLKQKMKTQQYEQKEEQKQQLKSIKSAQHFYRENQSQSESNQVQIVELSKTQTNKRQKKYHTNIYTNQNVYIKRQFHQTRNQNKERQKNYEKKRKNNEKIRSDQFLNLQKFNNAIKKLKLNLKQIKSISDTKQLSHIQFSSSDSLSKISQLNSNQDILS